MALPLQIAVNGTLMQGLPLHANLVEAGAEFVSETATAPCYKLWSIDDVHPAMMRVKEGGASIAVEVYKISAQGLASVLLKEPAGLCVGKVCLASGEEILGVLGESICCEGGTEITSYGGWRKYIESS